MYSGEFGGGGGRVCENFTFLTSPEQLSHYNQFCLKAFLGEEQNKFVKKRDQTLQREWLQVNQILVSVGPFTDFLLKQM